MRSEALSLVSPQAYLEFEEGSSERHEYIDGVVHALPGETLRHNQVAGNLYVLLHSQTRRGCSAAFANIKLWIPSLNRYYYPDVMVLCDPRDTDDKVFQYPCFIAEVLSPSTEGTNRREKLQAYRAIETLRGYLMLDPASKTAEYVLRKPEGWRRGTVDEVEVGCLELSIDIPTLFEGV